MNAKSLVSLVSVFVLIILGSLAVSAAPLTIDKVEVNGDTVTTTDTNRLDLERGQDLDVKVRMSATSNSSNVEVSAFISGFEFNRNQPISDVTPTFDVESGVTYVKKLKLRLPDLAEEDNYLLRIMVTDRFGTELVQNFKVKVDVPRHNLAIKAVVLNPESVVAGRALLATVRVKNMGEKDEEGIKVKVSIPDLGVSATDFIDELEADESTTSEELYLRIPQCAKPGDYDVKVSLDFNEGFDDVSTTKTVEVLASETCPQVSGGERTVIVVSTEPQAVSVGGSGTVYPISITNAGSTTKVYTLAVDSSASWATTRMSPSNVVTVGPGEARAVSLYVAANSGTPDGERVFTVSVKDQSGRTLEQLVMKANVISSSGGFGGLRKYLEVGLVVLVVLLIVIALIFIFSKLFRGQDEEEEAEPKTYY